MIELFAAVHHSGFGTFLPCQQRRAMSAVGCRPADICSLRGFRILTRSCQSEPKFAVMQQTALFLDDVIGFRRSA